MRPLNSDQLGEKGEAQFALLCADAGLICNKVGRDRTGWDFFVEFPPKTGHSDDLLDRRPRPPDCWIQVKTVWSNANHVSLRLSSADRLAKFLQPAAVIVFLIDNHLRVHDLYCIHMMDEALSQILKKTRVCQKKGSMLINKEGINLKYAELGRKLDPSGRTMRDAIEELCGGDRAAYIERKRAQVENLGVIGNRYDISFTLEAKSEREYLDFTTGLRTIKVSDFAVSETRWGITLPMHQTMEAEILIKPTPRRGQISARSKMPLEAVTLHVGIVTTWVPATSKDGLREIRLSNDYIEMIIERQQGRISITSNITDRKALSLKEYAKINAFQRIIASDTATLMIRDERKRTYEIPIEPNSVETDRAALQYGCHMLDKLKVILAAAGVDDLVLTSDQIYEQVGSIGFLHALLTDVSDVSLKPLKFSPGAAYPSDILIAEALILGRLPFDQEAVAYCAIGVAHITDDSDSKILTITQVKVRQVDIIGLEPSAFRDFDKDMQQETGLRLVVKLGDPEMQAQEAVGGSTAD